MENNNWDMSLEDTVKGIAGLAMLIVLAYYYFDFKSDKKEEQNRDRIHEQSNYTNYQKLDFRTVRVAINKNLVTAKDIYLNKNFVFEGEVGEVTDTDSEYWVNNFFNYIEGTDEPYKVEISQGWANEVDVYFMGSQAGKLKRIQKGDKIKFFGTITSLEPNIFGFMIIRKGVMVKILDE